MVRVGQTNSGSVRFVNCAFWGPCNQIAKIEGRGTVGFSDCTFVQWDHQRADAQLAGADRIIDGLEDVLALPAE